MPLKRVLPEISSPLERTVWPVLFSSLVKWSCLLLLCGVPVTELRRGKLKFQRSWVLKNLQQTNIYLVSWSGEKNLSMKEKNIPLIFAEKTHFSNCKKVVVFRLCKYYFLQSFFRERRHSQKSFAILKYFFSPLEYSKTRDNDQWFLGR